MTPLHTIGESIREALLLIPLPAVRVLFIAIQIALLIWVLRLPRSETTPPDDGGGWASNLKIWGSLALLMQVVVYAVL